MLKKFSDERNCGMNLWEAMYTVSDGTNPVVQLISASTLRKAAVKAEKFGTALADSHKGIELVSLSRRADVVI